jgi:hypothetical protein
MNLQLDGFEANDEVGCEFPTNNVEQCLCTDIGFIRTPEDENCH